MASAALRRGQDTPIDSGTPAMRRLNVAMVAAGLAAFALLYATQALLPDIGASFGVGATAASLTVSVATGALALCVLPVSALAERLGRTRVMTGGLVVAACSVLAAAASPSLWLLLILRAVDGMALAGVVAVAIGHIASSVTPGAAGAAIGLYISGTSVGGLAGRLLPAAVSETASWRWSMAALALFGAACTVVFGRLVPPHRPAPDRTTTGPRSIVAVLRAAGTARLCGIALLLMGGFVATYNYLTFRLIGHPFELSPSAAGFVFTAYLAGTFSSTAASRLASRLGRRTILLGCVGLAVAGLAITLSDALIAVLLGLVLFTAGFFGAHGVASGWAPAQAPASLGPAGASAASALYVLFYYLGSSVGGTLIGFAWDDAGWSATVLTVSCCYLGAALLAATLDRPEARDVGRRVVRWPGLSRPGSRSV